MAIFNEEYINEFFGIGKPKKQYHHLNRNEITKCINISKECLKEFPKLKKACHFINIYQKADYLDDEVPIKLYYEEPGDAELVVIDGDAWDGGYTALRSNTEEFWDDEENFAKSVNEKLKEDDIKAKFYSTGGADWDGIEFAITSLKEK